LSIQTIENSVTQSMKIESRNVMSALISLAPVGFIPATTSKMGLTICGAAA
jgi:hypothetical protein